MERFKHKVASIFRDGGRAEAARQRLGDEGFQPEQLAHIEPLDRAADEKLVPEPGGVRDDFLSRLGLGIGAGVLLGMLVAGLSIGPASNELPWSLTLGAIYGASILGVVAGLWAFRPRELRFAAEIKDRLQAGRHAVVIHTADRQQYLRARETMRRLRSEGMVTC